MKKIISKILKIFMSKEIYNNRRNNILFILYNIIEFFIKTLKLRIKKRIFFFLPSRHIGAIYLLNKINIIFKKEGKEFFLWDASLLGVARNQKAIAGSAADIDIAMIFDKKKHLKFILSLKKFFKIRIFNQHNAIQLFHEFGIIDISLFHKKGRNFEVSILDIIKDKGPTGRKRLSNSLLKNLTEDKFDESITKKLSFTKKMFFPLKKKELYSRKYLVPNKYLSIVKQIYGPNWKTPDKKEQVYFTK